MTTQQATEQGAGATRHKGAILAIILLSYFMILLDNSVIFTGSRDRALWRDCGDRGEPRPGRRRGIRRTHLLAGRVLHQRADRPRDDPARPAFSSRDDPSEGPL